MTWRRASAEEEETIVEMCLALYAEDPGQPVTADQVRRTLRAFREEPTRGCSIVVELDSRVVGYALLASFWSNEYGGEICTIDELYVKPAYRNRGFATDLFRSLGENRALWSKRPVALQLEVTPKNARARAFYERLGFRASNQTLRRRLD